MTISLPPVDRSSLIATRRDIHQHPELGFEETRTAALVAERLRKLDYHVTPGIGKTGVVGLKKQNGRCVLLRVDMDALPVEEANAVGGPVRSRDGGARRARRGAASDDRSGAGGGARHYRAPELGVAAPRSTVRSGRLRHGSACRPSV